MISLTYPFDGKELFENKEVNNNQINNYTFSQ